MQHSIAQRTRKDACCLSQCQQVPDTMACTAFVAYPRRIPLWCRLKPVSSTLAICDGGTSYLSSILPKNAAHLATTSCDPVLARSCEMCETTLHRHKHKQNAMKSSAGQQRMVTLRWRCRKPLFQVSPSMSLGTSSIEISCSRA